MYRLYKIVVDFLIIMVFLATIASTCIHRIFWKRASHETSSLDEKRKLAARPVFSWKSIGAYPSAFETYFNDHFGFRSELIRLNAHFMLKIAGRSPQEKFILGRDGWLFYRSEMDGNGYSITDYQGLLTYTDEELKHIKTALEDRRTWCQRNGISFVAIVPPGKPTIYSEYMPFSIRRFSARTRIVQLMEYMNKNSTFEIIDVRDILFQRKNIDARRLYYKGGTHWNQLGAYFGYREIMKRLAKTDPRYTPFELEDFDIETTPNSTYDSLLPEVTDVYYSFKIKDEALRKRPNIRKGKLLTLEDSFLSVVRPFLALHFEEIVKWDNFGQAIQQSWRKEKPDAVIYEALERNQHELIQLPAREEIEEIESK
jgi:hypothetical protein